MEEITGLPLEEDCLHCYLPPLIESWRDAHPQVEQQLILIQVAQTLGELVGSFAPDPACADRLVISLLRYVRDTAGAMARARAATGAPS